MNSKGKKAVGWSAFSTLACLNVYFGLGIWTPFLAAGMVLMAPPVSKFIKKKFKLKKASLILISVVLIAVGVLSWWIKDGHEQVTGSDSDSGTSQTETTTKADSSENTTAYNTTDNVFSVDSIPEYCGKKYVVINNNEPDFNKNIEPKAFEKYTPLDRYGRCVESYACVCKETMPTEKRGDIYSIKPSGWQHVEYDFVDGRSLYNRCHLIGFQLTAENDNERNLITGTRYMNTAMVPFENMVADYIKETNNHVIYKATPVFKDKELLARGVHMQAYSIEDKGEGICFNVYCYNVQPGVKINYSDGKSELNKDTVTSTSAAGIVRSYVLNTRSKKFHNTDCPGVKDIYPNNKTDFKGTREELINKGYSPCGKCSP